MSEGVRLDVWLWAARFYKTRSLAKAAIDSGHVRLDGERAKPAKLVKSGQHLRLRQGYVELEVRVLALSEDRRGAPEARLLYSETAESVAVRERERLQRQAAGAMVSQEKPSKKGRRLLERFKQSLGYRDD